MLNFEIINGVLQNAPDNVIFITKNNNIIKVTSNTNSVSPVHLIISGFLKDYDIPLYYESKTDSSNIFMNQIVFLQEHISYMKKHPNKVYNCSFKIGNLAVDNSFKISILVADTIITQSDQQDIIADLQNKYNDLTATLKNFMNKYPNIPEITADVPKGAVPVATGYGNTYVWDYPQLIIKELLDKIKLLSELIVELSEQNKFLTSKVSSLETKLNNHLNEQYIL